MERDEDFLPRNEVARNAVLKSREIVRKNNDFIQKIKVDSNIYGEEESYLAKDEYFSHEDSYAFDLYKIKSKVGLTEIFKDLLGL